MQLLTVQVSEAVKPHQPDAELSSGTRAVPCNKLLLGPALVENFFFFSFIFLVGLLFVWISCLFVWLVVVVVVWLTCMTLAKLHGKMSENIGYYLLFICEHSYLVNWSTPLPWVIDTYHWARAMLIQMSVFKEPLSLVQLGCSWLSPQQSLCCALHL